VGLEGLQGEGGVEDKKCKVPLQADELKGWCEVIDQIVGGMDLGQRSFRRLPSISTGKSTRTEKKKGVRIFA